MDRIRNFFLYLLVQPSSNRIVSVYQEICGIDHSKGKPTYLLLHYYFKISSGLGEDVFYLIPILIWVAMDLAVPFLTNFGLVMISGQLMKDILRLPRPHFVRTSEKAVRHIPITILEYQFQTEYGMPSTHAISGLLPVITIATLYDKQILVSPIWWIFSFIWVTSVSSSRLYMGVHTLYDIIGGLMFGGFSVLLINRTSFLDTFQNHIYFSPYGLLITISLLLLFLYNYPRARPWRAAYGTSSVIFGVWVGSSAGLWYLFHFQNSLYSRLLQCSLTSSSNATSTSATTPPLASCQNHIDRTILRIAIGVFILVFSYLSIKYLSLKVFTFALRSRWIASHREEMTDVLGKPVPTPKLYCIEVPVRILTYGSLGFSAILITPLVWRYLGII